jgi:acyl-CoA dehydrogenase
MPVFGDPDAPHGHMRGASSRTCACSEGSNMHAGRGPRLRDFAAAGSARAVSITACASIGAAERALEKMVVQRLMTREAFGKRTFEHSVWAETSKRSPDARIEIEAMRPVAGAQGRLGMMDTCWATRWPACWRSRWSRPWRRSVALQDHRRRDPGPRRHGCVASGRRPGAHSTPAMRTLRLADGPDEVHHMVVGRAETRKYTGEEEDPAMAAVWRK